MTADEKLARICMKVERAKKHFDDLKVVRQRFLDGEPYAYVTEENTETGYIKHRMTRVDPVPCDNVDSIGLILGDTVHCLRSTLDHLAYQLVVTNGGTPTRDTGFPLFRDAEKCKAMNTGKVQGMSDAVKNEIRRAEPYEGGKGHYLWVLHELDIIDKHRTLLTGIASLTQVVVSYPPLPSSESGLYSQIFTFPDIEMPGYGRLLKAGDVVVTFKPEHGENVQPTFDVAFGEPEVVNGKSIVETLEYLIQLVERTVRCFKPMLA